MKYAVFTVCMPTTTPAEAVTKVAACGGHGIEWRIIRDAGDTDTPGFWVGNRCTLQSDWSDAQFREVAALTRDAGLSVPNLGTYMQASDLEAVKRMMDVAKIFDSPCLRVGVGVYDGKTHYNDGLKKAHDDLAAVVELGRERGAKPLVETHPGTIVPSASLAHRVVSPFPADAIGVIYDPGNLVTEGLENYQLGMELLGDYLAHVHVKSVMPLPATLLGPQRLTFRIDWATPRAGMVDFAAVFAAMKKVGYDGWLSLEDFSTGMDEEWIIRDTFAFLDEMQNAG